jgi:hypothetical protein
LISLKTTPLCGVRPCPAPASQGFGSGKWSGQSCETNPSLERHVRSHPRPSQRKRTYGVTHRHTLPHRGVRQCEALLSKKTKRSFALRLVGVLWTESRVCRSLLGLKSAASVTCPSCGVECVPASAPEKTHNGTFESSFLSKVLICDDWRRRILQATEDRQPLELLKE